MSRQFCLTRSISHLNLVL